MRPAHGATCLTINVKRGLPCPAGPVGSSAMRSRLASLGAAGLVAASVPAALASDFGGSLRTVVRVQDLVQDDVPVERVRSWRSVDQHARLSWDDVGGRKAWTFDASLRTRFDWQTSEEKGHVEDRDLDVLLARASWKSREGLLD